MNWNKKAMLGLESKRLQSKIIAIVLNRNFKNTISVVTCKSDSNNEKKTIIMSKISYIGIET